MLAPLTGLAQGLADLEGRNYKVRLPRPQAQELAAIVDRFNALAEALDAARAENLRLNQRLITAQDDERRRTAHGAARRGRVRACSGSRPMPPRSTPRPATLPDEARRIVQARVRDMLAIIEHLQAINRSLLNRLRPMALGHVPLRELLSELVRERARQHPEIAFSFAADGLMRSYGDSIDLTIYRCIQESLTNAIRHAQAKQVGIELGEANAASSDEDPALELVVRDDGRGIDPTTPIGFGIRGMQERVQGLGGSYMVDGAGGRGTCVRIVIPVPRQADGPASRELHRQRVMTSVLIIDDHPIVLQGCRRVLEDAGVESVLEARDLESGYRLYRRHQPDVVIVDLGMQGSGLGGLSLIRRIRAHEPRTRILVFSMHSDPIIVARALEAGATGYVLKDTSSAELLKAFEKVRAGTPYLSNDLAMEVALVRTGVRQNPLAELTPRELQTLSLLAEGKPYGRIADELNVSYKTVVNVCSQLKQKLDARNLPELIRVAVRLMEAET